jgi:DNA-binding NarL/FixJ family response regulator
MSTRVLVVDDQELVRSGLCAILATASDIEVIGEAADGSQAIALAETLHPDVVLMDVRMPGTDGIEATAAIMSAADPPRVLILTTFDLDEYVFAALRAGAGGFVLKDIDRAGLLHAVRVVAGGDALLAPSVTRRLVDEFARRPQPITPASRLDDLTAREREVMLLVARGCSNAEIAGALFLSEATVKTHVAHILTKLGLRDRVQVVIAAYELGLVTPGETVDPPSPAV